MELFDEGGLAVNGPIFGRGDFFVRGKRRARYKKAQKKNSQPHANFPSQKPITHKRQKARPGRNINGIYGDETSGRAGRFKPLCF